MMQERSITGLGWGETLLQDCTVLSEEHLNTLKIACHDLSKKTVRYKFKEYYDR